MKNMNWQNSFKKYDIETNLCFNDNCDKYNKSDYHSKCYSICPNGTYNDNFLCKDCHPDCKICENPGQINNTNCKSCLSPYKFLHYGNCIDQCINGYYTDIGDSSNKICKCDIIKCFNCSKER